MCHKRNGENSCKLRIVRKNTWQTTGYFKFEFIFSRGQLKSWVKDPDIYAYKVPTHRNQIKFDYNANKHDVVETSQIKQKKKSTSTRLLG